jgi:hypothetical protein
MTTSALGLALNMCVATVLIPSPHSFAGNDKPTTVVADRGAKQPQAAVDHKGRIYVAFGRGNEVRCAVSIDDGRSFDVHTVGQVGALALGMRRGPRVAVTETAVIVTAVGGEKGGGRDGDLLAWRSVDGGTTWSVPRRVNNVEASAREGLHGMASGPGETVFCTWLDLRSKKTEVYGSLSHDGGLTWKENQLVYRSPEGSVCECCHPSAAFGADGTLYVMWRNQLGGARDLYVTRSSDEGETFDPAEKLGSGTWQLNACPMDGGALAVGPDGRVHSAWMRAGTMYSAEKGKHEVRLGEGVQGWTTYGTGGTYTTWLEGRPGKLMLKAPGESKPVTVASHANDPVVASARGGNGSVVLVWESGADGDRISCLVLPLRASTLAK